MIYLLSLGIQWVARALVPACLVLLAGSVVVSLVWWLCLRRNPRSVAMAWLALGMVSVSFGGWRSWEVWRDFAHPEMRMFRDYIANPLPVGVTHLAMASASPEMFHDGALIRFVASEKCVRQLMDHSLPGSKTLAVVAEIKSQSPFPSADLHVIAGTDGLSYLKVTSDQFPKDGPEAHRWMRDQIQAEGSGRDVYVLFRSGDWGHFQSVLTYDPEAGSVLIRQNLERRRSKYFPVSPTASITKSQP